MRLAVNAVEWRPSVEELDVAIELIERCEPTEAARIRRFKMPEDKKRSLLGRLLMRYACTCAIPGSEFTKLRFARTQENKPVCLDLQGGQFNISHHGSWVVLAMELEFGAEVGVDVMRYDQPKNAEAYFQSMRRQFTDKEWELIGSSVHMFHRHWALKESLVKAMGIGLGFDLQRASFCVRYSDQEEQQEEDAEPSVELEIDGRRTEEWAFRLLELDEMHCVAVALKGSSTSSTSSSPRFDMLDAASLVQRLVELTYDGQA